MKKEETKELKEDLLGRLKKWYDSHQVRRQFFDLAIRTDYGDLFAYELIRKIIQGCKETW